MSYLSHDPFRARPRVAPAAIPAVGVRLPAVPDEVPERAADVIEWVDAATGDEMRTLRAQAARVAELARPAGPRKTVVEHVDGVLGEP